MNMKKIKDKSSTQLVLYLRLESRNCGAPKPQRRAQRRPRGKQLGGWPWGLLPYWGRAFWACFRHAYACLGLCGSGLLVRVSITCRVRETRYHLLFAVFDKCWWHHAYVAAGIRRIIDHVSNWVAVVVYFSTWDTIKRPSMWHDKQLGSWRCIIQLQIN